MYFKREVKRCFLFVDYAQREFRKNNLYFLRHDFSRGNNFKVTFLVPGSPTLHPNKGLSGTQSITPLQ